MKYNFIDWDAQWAAHGLNFYDGKVHVDLGEYPELLLEPGPGFGDLSHPTTRLILRLMQSLVQDKIIVDVGSGSGVLALSALQMGAQKAYGIDIEEDANVHATRNAHLNGLQDKVQFVLPNKFLVPKGNICILMNMIWSEQKVAWESVKDISFQDCLISGILAEQREDYLKEALGKGWLLQREVEEQGWLAFHFNNKQK